MRQDPLGGVRAEGSFNIKGGGLVSAPHSAGPSLGL